MNKCAHHSYRLKFSRTHIKDLISCKPLKGHNAEFSEPSQEIATLGRDVLEQ